MTTASSERSASVPAPPRRTLKAPAAALARVQKVLPVEPMAPVRSRPQQAYDIPVTKAAVPSDRAENSPLDPEIAARRKERSERHNALAFTLRRRWPDLFTGPPVPWAIGMHRQIIAVLGCGEKDLRTVLSVWSQSPRRNLDGSEAGEPTPEERARAVAWLAELKAKRKG
jgi:hypothetical protein